MDQKLQQFIQMETEKAKMQNVLHSLNEKCWDTCFDGKPGNKIDSKTKNCLENCVDRFIDSNLMVVQRFEKKASQMGAGGLESGY